MNALRPRFRLRPGSRQASILIGVLWALAILFVVVVGVLHTSRIDLLITRNFQDRIQARYLALAGAERAKAIIFHDARERSRSRKPHSGYIYNSPDLFKEMKLGRGVARVARRAAPGEMGAIQYGVTDEEARLSLNTASTAELGKLQGMTVDVLAAIMDWRDKDNTASPGGAELDFYLTLIPPRRPRNGPFETVNELLMVRGVQRELLLGTADRLPEDLDQPEMPAQDSFVPWNQLLTAHSGVENVTLAGTDRVNVQNADERALTGIPGITPEIARAIVAYRGQRQFDSIVDLLDVTAPQQTPGAGPQGGPGRRGPNQNQSQMLQQIPGANLDPSAQGQNATSPGSFVDAGPGAPAPGQPQQRGAQPGPGGAPGQPGQGPRVISPELLMDIADDVSVSSDKEISGVVNVNSASREVLECLPGISRETAQAIINFRQSNGFLPNIAWLLKVQGITPDVLKQLAPRICTRSETYRILCEGRINASGTRQRIEQVVRIGLSKLTTLEYREIDL